MFLLGFRYTFSSESCSAPCIYFLTLKNPLQRCAAHLTQRSDPALVLVQQSERRAWMYPLQSNAAGAAECVYICLLTCSTQQVEEVMLHPDSMNTALKCYYFFRANVFFLFNLKTKGVSRLVEPTAKQISSREKCTANG